MSDQSAVRGWCALQADTENKFGSALVETFANSPFGQSAEKGAISLMYACTSPDMDGAWPAGVGQRNVALPVGSLWWVSMLSPCRVLGMTYCRHWSAEPCLAALRSAGGRLDCLGL